jgi:hypothetical protein
MRLEPLISHTGILMTFYLSIMYIAAHVWKIYDFKIEVVPLIINFSTELTTVVKFEVLVQKWCGRSCIGLFLYSYESEFLQKLVKDKKIHEARAFNFTYRYIDDVVSINNSRFAEFFPQRRQICYRWGTPAYWSLVPRSSMFYLFEFCLKNMWNCSLTQQILSHSFYDWKPYAKISLIFRSLCLRHSTFLRQTKNGLWEEQIFWLQSG